MSNVNFLDKLLDGVAVEWKALGEIGEVRMCKRIFKDQTSNLGDIPFYKIGTFGKTPNAFISRALFEEYRDNYSYPQKGEVLISASGTIGRTVIFDGQDAYFQDSNIIWVENNERSVLNKYLFYFYQVAEWNPADGGVIQRLYNDNLKKVKVPIPCPVDADKSLEIQAAIVRILDTFTELTAELTTELTARRQQYNYYRDQLLSFKEGEVDWKALGEIGEILRGTAITEKQTTPGEFPVVGNGPIHNYFHNKSNRSGETVVIARSGAYAGLVSHWNRPVFLTDAFSIHPDTTLLKTRFLYHVLKRDQSKIHYMGQGAGVPHVRAKDFESYKVPVPPIDEQARIVAILDRFDTLNNSNSEGLPREIELRQKQYEYYRNLLFSFPMPEAAA